MHSMLVMFSAKQYFLQVRDVTASSASRSRSPRAGTEIQIQKHMNIYENLIRRDPQVRSEEHFATGSSFWTIC